MTAAYATTDLLGLGIYSVSEAATYARVSTEKFVRWIIGTSARRPAVLSRLEPDKNPERWITFLDFVQAMAIRDIRIARPHLPLEKIRETVEMSRSKFGISYPFARKHTTYLLGDELRLNIEGVGLIEATGDHKSQMNIRPVVEKYLEDLSFDADGWAKVYTPFKWKEHSIIFDPQKHFGAPYVKPGRHTVATLCEAYEIEGSYKAAAKAYGVKIEAVEAAVKYSYDYLRRS
jgi:uncharacterized protein (DUF433 family)